MKLSIIQNAKGAFIVCDDCFHEYSVIILFTLVYAAILKNSQATNPMATQVHTSNFISSALVWSASLSKSTI